MMRTAWILAMLASVAAADGISWHSDLKSAQKEAVKSDKLIFIDFTADW